ncbi:hypothetical protein BH10ACI1_BH10ACI1_18480 [soil metagenome]
MKNFKIIISLIVGCLLLVNLVSIDATAQTKRKRRQKVSAKVIKCKDNDSDCFISAAKTCQKSSFTSTKSMLEAMFNPNVPHPNYNSAYYFEIKGIEKDKCIFYEKIEKNEITFSEDYIAYLIKDVGKTRPQVEQIMSEDKEAFQQTVGRDGVCSFQTEKLVDLLTKWFPKDGGYQISTADFEGANCQGTLFNFTVPNKIRKTS